MPVDICRPPAGKRSLTRVSGTSSFDIFRSNDTQSCSPSHATRMFNDATVKGSNPCLKAAREMPEDVSRSKLCRSDPQNQPSFARGSESQITFGEYMTPNEAEGLIVRRPRSECKQRDLVGNHILEENCGSGGLDVSGGFSFRPCSSSKTQELAGHDVFAFTYASDSPPPPVRVPYCPQERCIPPHEMPRNPKRLESHLQMGDLVVSPKRPSTCPSSVSYQIRSSSGEGCDFFSRARLVEEAKTRAFRGNNIFDFNDEPRNMEEDEHHFTLCKLARRRDLRGNDIFGDSKLRCSSDLQSPAPTGRRHIGPCNSQYLRENPLS